MSTAPTPGESAPALTPGPSPAAGEPGTRAAGGGVGAFRLAGTPEERDACMAIRFEVFVDEQQVPPELEPDEYDAVALHVLATVSGEPAATARVVDKGNGLAKIGRVAVRLPHRGTGLGRALMLFVLGLARERRFTVAALDAQVQVIPFYERLGFVAEGPVFDDAGIPHRHMTLRL